MSSSADVLLIWGCCDGELDDRNYLSCVTCNKAFHLACLTNCDDALRSSETWSCPLCSVKTRVLRDDNTPIRFNANVTVRGAKRQALHSPPKTCGRTLITDEIRDVIKQVLEEQMATMLTKINDSISALISEELRSVRKELQCVKDSVDVEKTHLINLAAEHDMVKETLENMKVQNIAMQQTITEIGSKLQHLEQNQSKSTDRLISAEVPAKSNVVCDCSSHERVASDSTADSDTALPLISNPSDSRGWSEIARRQNRRPFSILGVAGPNVTSLRAVEAYKHLHLWNMKSTADEILEYINSLCNTNTCTVEELTPKGNYKSFKIGVPVACYEKCYSADVWPVNARIKPWIYYRKRTTIDTERAGTVPNEVNNPRQTFRKESTTTNREVQNS